MPSSPLQAVAMALRLSLAGAGGCVLLRGRWVDVVRAVVAVVHDYSFGAAILRPRRAASSASVALVCSDSGAAVSVS
jgi:hypothetical protein